MKQSLNEAKFEWLKWLMSESIHCTALPPLSLALP